MRYIGNTEVYMKNKTKQKKNKNKQTKKKKQKKKKKKKKKKKVTSPQLDERMWFIHVTGKFYQSAVKLRNKSYLIIIIFFSVYWLMNALDHAPRWPWRISCKIYT